MCAFWKHVRYFEILIILVTVMGGKNTIMTIVVINLNQAAGHGVIWMFYGEKKSIKEYWPCVMRSQYQ